MNEFLKRYWWALALRGVIAILFGVLALMWPGLTLLSLIMLFAIYSLFGGVVSIIGAMKNRQGNKDWWLPLLLGLVSFGAGIVALVYPALTGLVLVLLIAANALVTGVLDILLALRSGDRFKQDKWLLIASGAASIVFGAITLLYPDAGALALIWMISFYAILTGVLLLAVAFSVRAKAKTSPQPDRRINAERRMSADRT